MRKGQQAWLICSMRCRIKDEELKDKDYWFKAKDKG